MSSSSQRSKNKKRKIADSSNNNNNTNSNVTPSSSSCHGVDLWKKLLFSEDLSDIKFVFSNGTTNGKSGGSIFAHKCVLSMASPYFKSEFSGRWKDVDELDPNCSLPVMKSILSFIYTGDTAMIHSLNTTESLFDVISRADYYEMPQLTSIVEEKLMSSGLSILQIKSILLKSDLYNLQKLKKECFDFIYSNWIDILLDSSFVGLAQEKPDLWSEMKAALKEKKKHDDTPALTPAAEIAQDAVRRNNNIKNAVISYIRQNQSHFEAGVYIRSCIRSLDQYREAEIRIAFDELRAQGLIFSTVDNYHYRASNPIVF